MGAVLHVSLGGCVLLVFSLCVDNSFSVLTISPDMLGIQTSFVGHEVARHSETCSSHNVFDVATACERSHGC